VLAREKSEHEQKIVRIRERIQERKLKAVFSDESEESEDSEDENDIVKEIPADIETYDYVKAQRKRQKIEIKNWV